MDDIKFRLIKSCDMSIFGNIFLRGVVEAAFEAFGWDLVCFGGHVGTIWGNFCFTKFLTKEKSIVNSKINLITLQKSKFINKKYKELELLGSGELKQKFDIELNSISNSAKEKIEKLGGKVTLIK